MDADFQHIFVPKQAIAKEDELAKMLEKYKITKEMLPRITTEDPVVKMLEANIGDVIKSLRHSPVTEREESYYRIVVLDEDV